MVQLITFFITLFTLLVTPLSLLGNENPIQVVKGEKSYKRASVVKAYRTCMKDKNFTQARQVLTDAMRQYPEAAADPQLRLYMLAALNELIGVENRKIYLNSKPDTVSYFNYIYELYVAGLQCDSVEQLSIAARLTEGKKASPKLRSEVGRILLSHRSHLLSAGKFHYKKKDYVAAFRYFGLYMQTKTANVFHDARTGSLVADPDDEAEVAVLAVLSAYGSSNYRGVMDYLSESLGDENLKSQMLEIGSKSAGELGDTLKMENLLEDGFINYPETAYFFTTLIKHYNNRSDYAKALERALLMTERYPQQRDYWYVVGTEQVLLYQDEEALLSFAQCIEIKADDAEAYAAIGNIYLRSAHDAYARFNVPLSAPAYAKGKSSINNLYKQACAAFEQARKYGENHPELWLNGLRETYFKLNRGKALKALDKYGDAAQRKK